MGNQFTNSTSYVSFGDFVKTQREKIGKTIRGLAVDLDMTPAYLSDIEKGNRYAPEKHLAKLAEAFQLKGEELNTFYDLAGKSRNNNFPDLTEYIGNTKLARVALRTARDAKIPESRWQEFIDEIKYSTENKKV